MEWEELDLLDLMETVPGMDLEPVMEKMEDREERMEDRVERMEEIRKTRIKTVEPDLMCWLKRFLILRIWAIL